MDGKDLIMSLGGKYYGYAGDLSWDMNATTEATSTTDYKRKDASGAWKESEVTEKNWTVEANYVVVALMSDYVAFVRAFNAGEPVACEWGGVKDKEDLQGPRGATGNIEAKSPGFKHSGNAIITKISGSAPIKDKVTFSVSLEGTGPLSVQDEIGG